MSDAIKSQVPEATVLFNQVPKPWYTHDFYCQLIPNTDDRIDIYDMIPRLGAFEVTTVFSDGKQQTPTLLFSKLESQMFPHIGDTGKRIGKYFAELTQENAASVSKNYWFRTSDNKRYIKKAKPVTLAETISKLPSRIKVKNES